MADANTTCKRPGCDKKFHTCVSCDLDHWEWGYCTEECYKKSKDEAFRRISAKYGVGVERLNELVDDLSEWIYT